VPVSFLILMDRGWQSYGLFLFFSLLIYFIAGAVSAAAFPLEVKRYDASVTQINLTK